MTRLLKAMLRNMLIAFVSLRRLNFFHHYPSAFLKKKSGQSLDWFSLTPMLMKKHNFQGYNKIGLDIAANDKEL